MTPYQTAHIAAWLLSSALVVAVNRRQGIRPAITLAVCAICVPTSVYAARALDALEYWSVYTTLSDRLARGGSSIYGALFVSFAIASAYVRWCGIPPLRFLDGAAPALAMGEAISRVGCFLQGCCYGVSLSPGLETIVRSAYNVLRGDRLPQALGNTSNVLLIHPVQLYSAIAASFMTVWLLVVLRHRRFEGEAFFTFLVLYGLLRIGVAPFRAEVLESMKAFSVIFIVTGGAGIWWGRAARRQLPVHVEAV